MKNKFRQKVEEILGFADIKVNPSKPREWDIVVRNEKFYEKVLAGGSISLGESYMGGWWDCKRLDEFFFRIFRSNLDKKVKGMKHLIPLLIKARFFNMQSISRAFEVGERHYDIGNEFYKYMLDKRLVYTCAYWKDAKTLDKAQEDKLDLVCRKIGLKKGMKVLDIGCGWGSFLKYAAEKYGIKGVGITISREQAELAREMCKGLDIEIRVQDYRNVNEKEKFDRIVSLGMFEHVGVKNYKEYMEVAKRNLKKGGLFLLHTIGRNFSASATDPWINKYIFPNGIIPSVKQIAEASEKLFVIEDFHNFGEDYDKTLMSWYENFTKNWGKIKSLDKKYNERFHRMWSYYLLVCAASFRVRKNQLWQIVFSKDGVIGGYNSVR